MNVFGFSASASFVFFSKLKIECFFVLRFGKYDLRSNLKNEGFIRALLSKFSVLTVVVILFFICAASGS
jgi:hypothetical protein